LLAAQEGMMMSFNLISPISLTVLQGVVSFSNEAVRAQANDAFCERNRQETQKRRINHLFVESIEVTGKSKETSGLA
jgi:hypothetical protein